jgi:benzoylformate decarboxylase
MPKNPITGRSAFLQLLVDEGVTHLFGNPGTTELPLMEVVPDFPQLKYVLGLQESVVLGMADGFGRASGRLSACNLHCTPGLGHAMGALYNAKFSGSPIIVTAGQYEIGHGLTEPLLYEPLVAIAQPLVKWAFEIERVQDLPRVVHRTAKIALTPPTGPVFLSLPGSILDDECELDLGLPTRVQRGVRPSDAVIEELVGRLLQAHRPVLLAGRELAERDAFAQAGELAMALGAAVYLESVPYNARFPAEHPAHMGDITRNQVKVRKTLEEYDLLICLGGDLLRMSPYSPVEPLPEGMAVVHISERDWELGKNYPTQWAICADVKETLSALLVNLSDRQTADQMHAAAQRIESLTQRNWSARRREAVARIGDYAGTEPIEQDYLMLRISEALPAGAILVEEAVTAAAAMATVLRSNAPGSYYGLASGGLGFAMPGAIGVSLAQPGKPVVAVVGDGSSLYSIQALWTAAHLRLPITYVIVNNRSYRIIKERLVAMRKTDAYTGMDLRDPTIDFVAVAQGFGVSAVRVTRPQDIDAALHLAITSGGPALVEVVVGDGFGGYG